MEKYVLVNGELVPVKIEVKHIDKYNHILVLNDVEHPITIVLRNNRDVNGEDVFSHYTYQGEKALDKNGKVIDTDKGLIEFILNRK